MVEETVQAPPVSPPRSQALVGATDLEEAHRAAQEAFSSKQMGGKEPNVAQRYRRMWSLLAGWEERESGSPWEHRASECRSLLRRAGSALRRNEWTGQDYDAVWSDLHEARHLLCALTDSEGLLELVHDVRSDAQYVPIDMDRAGFLGQLGEVEQHLLKGPFDDETTKSGQARLRHLSVRTGRSRESMWRRVHRIEDRLRRLRWYLLVGLVLVGALVPGYLQGWPWLPAGVRPWGELVVLVLAGAFGSLINIVRERDATDASAIDYHLRKARTWIRPAVAAAIVLILYVVAKADLLQLPFGSGAGGASGAGDVSRRALHWTLAFFAGFLDATVIGQIERIGQRAIAPLGETTNREKPPPENKDKDAPGKAQT